MWRPPPSLAGLQLLAGPPVLPEPPLQAGPLKSLAGMVGVSWDLQAEGYRRGEGTDLVAPATVVRKIGQRVPVGSPPRRSTRASRSLLGGVRLTRWR